MALQIGEVAEGKSQTRGRGRGAAPVSPEAQAVGDAVLAGKRIAIQGAPEKECRKVLDQARKVVAAKGRKLSSGSIRDDKNVVKGFEVWLKPQS